MSAAGGSCGGDLLPGAESELVTSAEPIEVDNSATRADRDIKAVCEHVSCGGEMDVTVVGSGNGGLATAFDFALHGHSVRLFDTPHFPDHAAEVSAAGGIHATGELEGFARIAYAGHDIDTALDGAELVMLVGPA